MIKKILIFAILAASLNASVFDYRVYYGKETTDKNNINALSMTVYSYIYDTDFSLGVQGFTGKINDTQKKYILNGSLVAGYDVSRIVHLELSGGLASIHQHGRYHNGYGGSGTILLQSNLNSFLEALQLGATYKIDNFTHAKNENSYLFFIGFGF